MENLSRLILNSQNFENKSEKIQIVFAKRIDGKFLPNSEALVLDLSEMEIQLKNIEIANKYCPGLNYFLELHIIIDLLSDLRKSAEGKSYETLVDRIIYYAEFDA